MPSDTAPAMSASSGSDASLTLAAIRAYRTNLPLEPGALAVLMAERDSAFRPLYPAITRILHEDDALGRRIRAASEMLSHFDDGAFARITATVANESERTVRKVVETVRRQPDRSQAFRSLLRLVGPDAIPDETVMLMGEIDVLTSILVHVREERARLVQQLAETEQASYTDALTGVANRRSFERILNAAVTDARNRHEPLSLVMLDIDRFKTFNDQFGHETGDMVLRLVARTIGGALRDGDTIARFGGEEFVVVLPSVDRDTATKVAERLRYTLEAREVTNRRSGVNYGTVTASFGVASLRSEDGSLDLLRRADRAMYAAKANGRNRVETAD